MPEVLNQLPAAPLKLSVWGFPVEVHEDHINIYDTKNKLQRDGSRKIAVWLNAEGFIMVPFNVKVYREVAI